MFKESKYAASLLAIALTLTVSFAPMQARAISSGDLLKDFLEVSASVARDNVQNDKDFDDAAFDAVVDTIIAKISQSIVQNIIKAGGVVTEAQFKSAVEWHMKTNLTRIRDINRAKAGTIGADMLVGFAIDAAADAASETVGGALGEWASYGIKQTKVLYASVKYGIHAAIMEQTVITGTQVVKAVELSIELNKLKDDNNVKQAINNANQDAAIYRRQYLTASTASEKKLIEEQISAVMRDALVVPKFWSGEKEVPGGQALVDRYIANLQAADRSKFTVVQGLTEKIAQNPQAAMAYRDLVFEFLRNNFPAGSDFFEKQFAAVTQTFEITARASTTELRQLVEKSRSIGGAKNLSPSELSRMSDLARGLDSSLNRYGNDEVVRRVFTRIDEFEAEFGVNLPQPLPPVENVDQLTPWTPPISEANPPEEFDGENDQAPISDDDSNSDLNDDDKIDFADDAQRDETEPTGPTPEEIAEAERQAELERQRLAAERLVTIAALEDERTRQYLVKLDAEARIRNNNNRLTILEFDERERVQNVLSVVNTEAARLRGELNSTGLSDEDAKRLQDIMRYGEVLEGELDRIASEEVSLRTRNADFQQALDAANATIIRNSNQLNTLNYDWNQYTIPTISVVLPDWSNYEYELPPFNQTDAPTTDLRNAVVSSVSLPVTTGTIRNSGTLVSEDGEDTRFDTFGFSESQSEKLDDFNHLFIGRNSAGLQWIYGEASTPEQFALRTGTATFRGGLSGYYAHGSLDSNTVYQDSVFGSLTLNIDFGSNLLTGEGSLEIDNAARSENLSFTLNEAAISATSDGLTRSLRFSSSADLLNRVSGNGNFSGAFYGADASEAAGSFAFGLVGGFAAGIWAAGENYVPDDTDNGQGGFNGAFIIGYDSTTNSHGTAWDESEDVTSTQINYSSDGVDGSVNINTTLAMAGFSHVSWGTWVANDTTRDALGDRGYWVDVDNLTASSVLQNRTGSAEYAGEIVGGYVSYGNIREDAQGLITLTADFANQSVSGRLQFGRDCSGVGMSGCYIASQVASFDEPINDYDGNGFGDHSHSGTAGVVAVFGGPNGQEIGGHTWLTEDQGQYIGVFRAGEGLSFGGFVTPTETDAGTDYSNYRGLISYLYDVADAGSVTTDFSTDFASVSGVDSNGVISVVGTTGSTSIDDANIGGGTYNYVSWGSWNASYDPIIVGSESREPRFSHWLVYDPTTDLPQQGQATYTGQIDGQIANVGGVYGNIDLNADFANDQVTGNMSVIKGGDGSTWADASFDASITRSTNSSGFQGALTGTDVNSGVIFGGFAGPNAEEVGGGWQIDHTDGSSANGIFRASQ